MLHNFGMLSTVQVKKERRRRPTMRVYYSNESSAAVKHRRSPFGLILCIRRDYAASSGRCEEGYGGGMSPLLPNSGCTCMCDFCCIFELDLVT